MWRENVVRENVMFGIIAKMKGTYEEVLQYLFMVCTYLKHKAQLHIFHNEKHWKRRHIIP